MSMPTMDPATLPPDFRFDAPWGRPLRWISIGATVLLLGLTIFLVRVLGSGEEPAPGPPGLAAAAAAIPALILIGAAAFVIRAYSLPPGFLCVHRLGWRTRLPLRGLESAEVVPRAMTRSLRLFGNGGLFSFSGLFWNRSLGRFRAFVTDLDSTVVLQWPDRTVVVSPNHPERFVNAVRAITATGAANTDTQTK